jgi:hypothetical protein
MARAIVRALRDQRVSHLVALSSIGADRDRGVGPVAGLHEFEQKLRAGDLVARRPRLRMRRRAVQRSFLAIQKRESPE